MLVYIYITRVWRVRYNSFHDQLFLTAGSDSRVLLHCLPTISSEPQGHAVLSDAEENEISPQPYENILLFGMDKLANK